MKSRYFKQPPVLVPNAPLTFTRELPRRGATGPTVEVAIHLDLSVTVLDVSTGIPLLLGRYSAHALDWDAIGNSSATDRAVLAADVHSVLLVFEQRLLEPSRWTSEPLALAALS